MADWQRANVVDLSIKAVLGPAQTPSGSHAFPVLGSDGERWIMKAPNNPQGARILVTEFLMSEVGHALGVPVCEVKPMMIIEEFVGTQIANGPILELGIGSASRQVPDVVEIRGQLTDRERDDNRRRHAAVFAFFDWCWGDDPQWLVCETADQRLYSHDHGFYLPPGGQDWTPETLAANVDIPHLLPGASQDGLDVGELERLAAELRGLEVTTLNAIFARVPSSWPASDADLEAVGEYLLKRAPQVASRIDELRARLGTS